MHARLSLSVVEYTYMRGAIVCPHGAKEFIKSIRDIGVTCAECSTPSRRREALLNKIMSVACIKRRGFMKNQNSRSELFPSLVSVCGVDQWGRAAMRASPFTPESRCRATPPHEL